MGFRVCGVDSTSSRQGPVAGSCKRDHKPTTSTEVTEFLDQMIDDI